MQPQMVYAIRPMTLADVPQVTAIEKEAFPGQWPATPFRRELANNRMARYLVAYEVGTSYTPPPPDRCLWGRLKSLFFPSPSSTRETDLIVGFVGMWFVVDEAHIITIAVRESQRRRGIGELLLAAAVELAQEKDEELVTLEVRASNTAAQALYEKYGFRKVGVRRRYYTDDGEDAWNMTTGHITSAPYQANFQLLKQQYLERWGSTRRWEIQAASLS